MRSYNIANEYFAVYGAGWFMLLLRLLMKSHYILTFFCQSNNSLSFFSSTLYNKKEQYRLAKIIEYPMATILTQGEALGLILPP